jgi:hypothetical protein
MNSLKILSAAAALALVLPLATPSASFAQSRFGGGGGGGHAAFGGGGGGARIGGGAVGGGAAFRGGGGNFAGSAAVRPGVAAPTFSGGSRVAAGAPSGNWNGGNWRGGGWGHRGGFWPGVAAGAAIGALGSYAYYGGPSYDSYYYGDDYYYDDSPAVAVVPDTRGDSAAYCAQRYRSYDPASGTYLGYDGLRHPCP